MGRDDLDVPDRALDALWRRHIADVLPRSVAPAPDERAALATCLGALRRDHAAFPALLADLDATRAAAGEILATGPGAEPAGAVPATTHPSRGRIP